jgi:hypothetical protein
MICLDSKINIDFNKIMIQILQMIWIMVSIYFQQLWK